MATIPNAVFLGHAFAALNPATVTAAADAVPAAAAAAGLAHTVTPVGVGGASLTASLGEASSVGGLSVPAGWSTAAPAMTSGAFDDKIAANDRVIEAAEALMLAIVGRLSAYVPLSSLASRSTACLDAQHFDSTVAHYSFAAFDGGAQPSRVGGRTIRSAKLVVSQPCVLFPKLNPRIPRIWNITSLPSEMALASTEFVVLRPVGVDTSALWAALRQPDVLAELRQLVGGMTGSRQRIQPTQLLRVWVRDVRRLTPGHAAAIANLGALCNERRIESARLASCRDALLPLLMSGIDGLPAGR
nr:hypothetical protein [Mycobacterium tuberculosis]